MNTTLYTAASGLRMEQLRMDTIANNLANTTTDGFRPRRTFVESFHRSLRAARGQGAPVNRPVATAGTFEVQKPGTMRSTERSLDVALRQGHVLAVQTADGVRYTRNGSLSVDAEGTLTDSLGRPVLGPQDRTIDGVPAGAEIRANGDVAAGDAIVGRLQLWADPDGALRPQGENLLHDPRRFGRLEEVTDPELSPGWLESSAANPLDELVRLIQSQRAFQSYQKLVTTTMNDVNRKSVNDLAG